MQLHLSTIAIWCFAGLSLIARGATLGQSDPLLDYSDWQKFRGGVEHPTLAIKPADLARAQANAKRYPWAKTYVDEVVNTGESLLKRFAATPSFIESMIPTTTPGDPLFTPCPACRDQEKPYLPHGQWRWSVDAPDELQCTVCQTVFPNAKYPESIELETKWNAGENPQRFTFYGGETFPVFGYPEGRPSFTGAIRARKVATMTSYARQLAEAYALTQRPAFASAVRSVLLRFAQVYPGYLVHVGYGEYADCDPRIGSFQIENLPEGAELCYAPNKPDGSLHTAFWSAGRAGAVGAEGRQLQRWAESYDFTCEATDANGQPIYSADERMKIEKDLLLEATVLLVADKGINNKSVQNRSAVAMVGMSLGHPGLTRFGLEGFEKAINDWFLPDAHTPESPAYSHMTIHGVRDAAQVYRGYSDPPGYTDANGKRIDGFDPYNDPSLKYGAVWRANYETMQGDLTYPPFADSYTWTKMPAAFAELMVANYPDRPEYVTLLAELCGPKLDKDLSAATAVYYREPGLESRVASAPKLKLPDICPPELKIGYLRTGDTGRESLLLLSASDWGAHHHADSLNLYYWKNGQELLNDLGYLWDHPDKKYLARTFAHNTVLIDEANQQTTTRKGTVDFFVSEPRVKAMRASSTAYPNASRYQRTSAIIIHDSGKSYVVDFFFVKGGKTQDFVYHGPNNDVATELIEFSTAAGPLYDLKEVRMAETRQLPAWSATWSMKGGAMFRAWNLPGQGEVASIGTGWGQRDHKNADRGATLPYIVRRTTGDDAKIFASAFEGWEQGHESMMKSVTRLPIPQARQTDTAAIEVFTPDGIDVIICSFGADPISVKSSRGDVQSAARLSVTSFNASGQRWTFAKD